MQESTRCYSRIHYVHHLHYMHTGRRLVRSRLSIREFVAYRTALPQFCRGKLWLVTLTFLFRQYQNSAKRNSSDLLGTFSNPETTSAHNVVVWAIYSITHGSTEHAILQMFWVRHDSHRKNKRQVLSTIVVSLAGSRSQQHLRCNFLPIFYQRSQKIKILLFTHDNLVEVRTSCVRSSLGSILPHSLISLYGRWTLFNNRRRESLSLQMVRPDRHRRPYNRWLSTSITQA